MWTFLRNDKGVHLILAFAWAFFSWYLLRQIYVHSSTFFTPPGQAPWLDRACYFFAYGVLGSLSLWWMPSQIGLKLDFPRRTITTQGVLMGLVVGLGCVALAVTVRTFLPETGHERLFSMSGPLLLLPVLITPVLEEFYYRGLLQNFLKCGGFSSSAAIFIQAMAFGLGHYFVAPFLAFMGLVFGLLADRYGLHASFMAHAVYNLGIICLAIWFGKL